MNKFEKIIHRLHSNDEWGTYFLRRYYFSIKTAKTRKQAGLTDINTELTKSEQTELQREHLPAFFHEYLHYIQETSAIVGHASMLNSMVMKAIFTSYKSPDNSSSESLGAKANFAFAESFANAALTNAKLDGSGKLDVIMRKIDGIELIDEEVHFPAAGNGPKNGTIQIPQITYSGYKRGLSVQNRIFLGRFYLYECLAYELDQILERRQKGLKKISDPHRGSEYTVCRMVAQHIFPLIRQESAMAAALLAMQHIDAGNAFLTILNRLAKADQDGIDQTYIIENIKKGVSRRLQSQRSNFFAQQDEFIKLFEHRNALENAYGYVTSINKKLYDLRVSNPCFELDWMLSGQYDQILENAIMCDYLYIFQNPDPEGDDPEYFRDFMGTILPEEISQALKALVAFDHYFFAHHGMTTKFIEARPKEEHCCPFFTCCDLAERKSHREICRTKPWRIYEILFPQKKHCWYSSAVLETKATTR